MKNVFFSVLVPVYNTENFVGECIESILAQTYGNFEIILVNDGSTDRSSSICDDYALVDERIRVYHKENEKLMMTRRFSISKAKGDYFVFLDSDDTIVDHLLEVLNKKIAETESDLIIYNYKKNCGTDQSVSTPIFDREITFNENNKEVFIKQAVSLGKCNQIWTKVIKRELALQDKTDYNAYRNIITSGEDIFQSIPIIFLAKKILYIPEPYVNYRILTSSISRKFNPDKISVQNHIYKRKKDYLEKYKMWTKDVQKDVDTCYAERIINICAGNLADSNFSVSEKKRLLSNLNSESLVENYYQLADIQSISFLRRKFFIWFTNKNYNLACLCLYIFKFKNKLNKLI